MSQATRRSISLVETIGGRGRPSESKHQDVTRQSEGGSGLRPGPDPLGRAQELRWPHCPYADRTCLLYDMAHSMGRNVHDTLVSFILAAEEGARLTLQRNRDGFTVQVTRAVQKTAKDPMNAPGLWALRPNLETSDLTM